MSKAKDHSLAPTELEIMSVLWVTGPANVQTTQQQLPRELAYTTVQTMLNILHRKGKVRRTLKDRAYFYKAVVSRQQVISHTVGGLIDQLFGGSVEGVIREHSPDKTIELAPRSFKLKREK